MGMVVAAYRLIARNPATHVDPLHGADLLELLEDPVDRRARDAPGPGRQLGLDLERRQGAALSRHQLEQLAPRAAAAVTGVGQQVGDPLGPLGGVVTHVSHPRRGYAAMGSTAMGTARLRRAPTSRPTT